MKTKDKVFLISLVALFSGWTINLIKTNSLIWFISILLSYFLLDYLIEKTASKFRKIVIFLLTLIIIAYSLFTFFDKGMYQISEVEKLQITARYQYYFKELGFFYANNKALVHYLNKDKPIVNKYLNNQSKVFDIETFFPSKFPLILLPFALIGIYNLLRVSSVLTIIFFTLIIPILGFTNTGNPVGPIIFYPTSVSLIAFGAVKAWVYLR